MTVDGYVISIGILSFLMSFSIGANDAANALATSYGSNALRLIYLVLLGSLFEFIGAYFCSGHVAGKLVGNVIEEVDALDDALVEKMMLGTSISSFIFIMASSVFGMPISGTHTVVGALIGSGLAALGGAAINWGKLGIIVASWFVAPIVSIFFCSLFFVAVCALTLNSQAREFQKRLIWLTCFTGVAFAMICFMLIKLLQQDGAEISKFAWTCLALSLVLGIFVTRLVLLFLVKPRQIDFRAGLAAVFKFYSTAMLQEMLHQKCRETQSAPTEVSATQLSILGLENVETQPLLANEPEAGAGEQLEACDVSEKEKEVIFEVYRYLMLTAAMMVCLGHGSNDVANSISPFLVVLSVEGDSVKFAYLLGSLGIALGLLILGFKVMETVGKKVIKLDYPKGFTAQFATALAVNSGSIIGIPLSTTHCMVGSLMGLILAQRFEQVKAVYPDENDQNDVQAKPETTAINEAPEQTEAEANDGFVNQEGRSAADAVKGPVIVKIVSWWVATVPVALGVSYAITKIII